MTPGRRPIRIGGSIFPFTKTMTTENWSSGRPRPKFAWSAATSNERRPSGPGRSGNSRARHIREKRISGIYYAKSLLDDRFDTFFLEVKSPSILEGYWCGYDSENHEVFGGKYLFKKVYKCYLIREVREEDFIGVARIGDAQLGRRYVTPSFLREAMAPSSPYRCIVAADKKTGKVIGFLIYETINYQTLEDITKGKLIGSFRIARRLATSKRLRSILIMRDMGLGML